MKFGAGVYWGALVDLSKQLSLSVDGKYVNILDFKDFANAPSWAGVNIGLNYKF